MVTSPRLPMIIRGLVLLGVFGLLVAACAPEASSPEASVETEPSVTLSFPETDEEDPLAHIDWVDYVGSALDWVEANYYDPDSVDWDTLRAGALAFIEADVWQFGAYDAITGALATLGDPQAVLVTPYDLPEVEAVTVPLTGRALPEGVGYLQLPTAVGGVLRDMDGGVEGELYSGYATVVHDLAREVDDPPVCGWVIDLRSNRGGQLGAMALGVGPFLGDSEFLSYRKLSDEEPFTVIAYDRTGRLVLNGEPVSEVPLSDPPRAGKRSSLRLYTEPFVPTHPEAPVAVLISSETARTGEALTVAFRGRPATRLFGEPTSGNLVHTVTTTLDDGSKLTVSAGVPVDGEGTVHTHGIAPDELVVSTAHDQGDPVIDRAIEWLSQQPSCGSG